MKKKAQPVSSAPIQLLDHIWKHMQRATSHSWLKVNHSLRETLSLALRAGMKFHEDDISLIFKERYEGGFRAGHWMNGCEWFYSMAVAYRNASAWKAYEKWAKRKAFIMKNASLSRCYGDGPCGQGLSRLVEGADFFWKGERVTVTSFKDGDKPYLVACSYKERGKGKTCKACKRVLYGAESVIHHRYKITHKDLHAVRPKKARAQKQVGSPTLPSLSMENQ